MKPTDLAPAELPAYYRPYVGKVPDLDLVAALSHSHDQLLAALQDLTEAQLSFRYAEDKWTIKEMILHLVDAERVFAYRAMRFARADQTELPGFDQDAYVMPSRANERSLESLLAEYTAQRQSTITLFKYFNADMLTRTGMANHVLVSVQATAYIIAGHDLHHLEIIQARYLKQSEES